MGRVMFACRLLLALFMMPNLCQALESARPNVVVFLVDDMGWQETSVPFHTEVTELNRRYHTPNMERMANQGVKFTQAYASAVCSPTRVSLLSGMNAARHRVTNWTLRKDRSPDQASKFIEPPRWNLNGITTDIDADRATRITPLAALLKTAGYRTIHVGKAHFGAKGTAGEDPQHFGFDVNIAGHAAGGPGSYWGEKNFSAAWRSEDRIWDVPGLESYHGQNIYLTEALTREAIKNVEVAVKNQEPFYLYLSHYAIHAPWEKDDRFYQKYIDAGLKPFEATLASMIEGMDKSLGDVLDTLERLGVDENTVVLFLSDNGSPSQCPQNLPLRGHKITPYEGGIRVPMLARWPGVIKSNSVNTSPIVAEDFFPTILELAGIIKPETVQTVDGNSFVSLLKGEGNTASDRPIVWHYPHQYSGTPFSAVRQHSWKLIYHHNTRNHELFNLAEDISESHDLAPSQPDKTKELTKVLGERLRAMDAQMPIDKATGQPVEWPDQIIKTATALKPVDVYLLGGQSNMQGVGKIAEIPSEIPKEIPYTYFWTGQKFEPLVLGQTKTSRGITEFGPEVGFAIQMASAQKPVYLIKYHASGMPLHHGWDGGRWKGGEPAPGRRNFYPGEKSEDANVGTLYAAMRNQFQAGVKYLDAQGFAPTVRGFVWMQGEQDSKHEVSAKAYAKSLKHLRHRLSEDMKTVPDLPLVFGQVLPHELPLERFSHRQEIREQMAACDSSSNKPEAMKNTKMVSTDGFPLLPDTVHYDAAGQLKLGKAFALAMEQLLPRVPAKDAHSVPAATELKVPESSLCKALQWKGVAIEEQDFCIWGASPIFADGQYHLFAARWPESNVDPAWRKSSEIAQYTADKPEGPFAFRQVVLRGTGKNGDWDAFAPHNPEIKKFGNVFALCYIANSDFHQPPHPLNQQIGMMVADNVNGPWTKVGEDGLILSASTDPGHFSHGKQVVNPTLIQVGTKYHLYFKTGGAIRGTTAYGLAVSDQLTGPYRMLDESLTTNGVTIEDGTIFEWDGKICLLTTDNHGQVTGITGGGALWVSDDGVHFKSEWTQLGYKTIPQYYSEYDSQRVTKVYGRQPKFERPKVLCIDNRPAWLYAPSGWNVTGGKRTVNHVLKIDLQPQEGPLSGIPIQVPTARVMTFNILQGAADAGNVGFDNASFGGSRLDEIVDVIRLAQADVVGVQEDSSSDNLLKALGSPWQRVGSVYSRLPVKEISVDEYLTVVAVGLPGGKVVTIVNCHWFPPRGGYGPDLAQAELRALPDFVYSEAVAKRIIEKCSIPNGTRGYNATLQPLKAAIESGKNVILTGDFNEPSHLDWTQRYAEKGSDRWVMNPTDVPLRFAVEWPGSTQLAKAGLIDSYRMIHSDEVVKPGITWTPKYAENTPGRRPYHEQVLDRIDRVYHSGDSLRPIAAEVVGEAREVADLVFTGRWPSDHRAVVVTFECQ